MSSPYRTWLALFGTMVWGSACGMLFLLVKYVYAPQARLPVHLLFIGFIFLCLVYFATTVFGLWVGSRRRGTAASHKATTT